MFEKGLPEIVQLTPTVAHELLELNTFPGQRKLRMKEVARLESIILGGLFLVGEIGVATLKYELPERKKHQK